MQLLNIYNPVSGGGLYLRPDSEPGMDRIFIGYKSVAGSSGHQRVAYADGRARQRLNAMINNAIIDNSLGLGLAYPEQDLVPGKIFLAPPAVIGFHQGDFHEALTDYKSWVKTWFKRNKPEVPDWIKYDFIRFTGSPLRAGVRYDLEKYIEQYKRLFGGGGCFLLATWWNMESDVDAFGRKKEEGKEYQLNHSHGNYFEFVEKYGGRERLRQGVQALKEAGMKVGFYVDGYCRAKHTSEAGRRYGKEWALINSEGNYYTNWCSEHQQNWNCCPAYPPHQEWLASVVVNLVKEFDIDWLYLDILGALQPRPCYNPLHNHETPGIWMQGIEDMPTKIREEVGKIKPGPFPIINEGVSDYSLQFVDGGLDLGWLNEFMEVSPVPLNIFRFCFPEALVHCFPYLFNFQEEEVYDHNYMLFNGLGLYTEIFGDLIPRDLDYFQQVIPIMRENADAFRGNNPYPLMKTEAEGLYANSFPNNKGSKRVITLYNTNSFPLKGNLINLPYREGFHYVDLLNRKEITYQKKGDQISLSLELKPKEVIPLGELPQLVKVKREGANLEVSIPEAKAGSLRLLLLDEYNELFKKEFFPFPDSPFTLNLKDTFGTEKGKLVVQFFKGRFLVDEAIVEGEALPPRPVPDIVVITDDDQRSFWWTGGDTPEGGTISAPVISDDATIKQSGANSLKMVTKKDGSYRRWFIEHKYSPPVDFSEKDLLVFYWYGANSGGEIYICLPAPDWEHYYETIFVDDFSGWKRLAFPLNAFKAYGNPSLKRITNLRIRSRTDNLTGTWYLDRVSLGVTSENNSGKVN